MRVLVAPDKFKGTASALAAAEAMAVAFRAAGHAVVVQPMADGGEGTLAALGGANRVATVSDPLGRAVEAPWRLRSRTAVIEAAAASGLGLVGGAEGNDPIAATTRGTGELIDTALQRGARRVIVGVGGSATTDGGLGAIEAVHPVQRLRGVDLVVACDVRTTFVDAAVVFAPQKGATPAQVALLTRRLERLVGMYRAEHGVDVAALPGGGAAGGLAGGLAAVGARLVEGFQVVADAVDLFSQMEGVDLVVTGEGCIDAGSFAGKVVGGVAALATDLGIPVVAIAGRNAVDESGAADGSDGVPAMPVRTLVDAVGEHAALVDTVAAITETTARWLAEGLTPDP